MSIIINVLTLQIIALLRERNTGGGATMKHLMDGAHCEEFIAMQVLEELQRLKLIEIKIGSGRDNFGNEEVGPAIRFQLSKKVASADYDVREGVFTLHYES